MEDKTRHAECGMQKAEREKLGAELLSQDDEQMLERFFADNTLDILDNGFSQQVMRQLPQRATRRMNRVWAAACWLGGVVLFLLFDGVESLRIRVFDLMGNLYGFLVSVDPITVLHSINFTTLAVAMVASIVISCVTIYNKLEV